MIRLVAIAGCAAVLAACAARIPARPTGAGMPDATAADAFIQATRSCGGLRTVTGALRLSGRAGGQRIRGTVHAGLAAPASIRFEAVAPFGQPFFILAGRDNRATLLLPRDNRVLTDAAVPHLLARLTGLGLAANDVRLILSGCLAASPTPSEGRRWTSGWRAVTVGSGITAWLRDLAGVPTVVAADHGTWRVDYGAHQNGWPRVVRLRSAEEGGVDLTARIDDLAINAGIDEQAFVILPPPGARPMSLDQLRSVTPLRGSH